MTDEARARVVVERWTTEWCTKASADEKAMLIAMMQDAFAAIREDCAGRCDVMAEQADNIAKRGNVPSFKGMMGGKANCYRECAAAIRRGGEG